MIDHCFQIVHKHQPLQGSTRLPSSKPIDCIAVVLGTSRSYSSDMILDHQLWFTCMSAVTVALKANVTSVHGPRKRRFFDRFRHPQLGPNIGSLEDYGQHVRPPVIAREGAGEDRDSGEGDSEEVEPPDWETILWHQGAEPVACATVEPWYAIGGPAPYHDSYTTSIEVLKEHAAALVIGVEAAWTLAKVHLIR